ncbi:MAG: DinB family protein, partial [Ilumatobacter sp.]|nr:DinB family protein [Ilumatobacter sp.]
RWQELLSHPRVADRPNDHTWSALEYACHVRDVYRLYLYRLGLMLEQDGPHFPNWDQDVTAVEDRYDLQDPATVAAELVAAAEELAGAFAAVRPDQLGRTGYRSDGAAFTIDSFTRYMVHDPVHHVWDAEQGYAALAG